MDEASVGIDTTGPVAWSTLRGWVQRYLEQRGMPAMQAESLSHQVVVACASEAETIDPQCLIQKLTEETDTLLMGWRPPSPVQQVHAS